jgi:heat shock protein HtpX
MWEQIRYNQTRTALLIAGIGAIWLLLGYIFGILAGVRPQDRFETGMYGVIIASILWVLAVIFAYYFGDRMLLTMSGARKITTGDLHRIYDIVEELQLASGLETTPATYVIKDPSMNAFAIGRDPKKAAVIVTSGLLTRLNRDELQGVIGHEIAHIKNRDVLLMSICTTLFGTIQIVTWLFSPKRLFEGGSDREDNPSCLTPILVTGFLIILGVLISREWSLIIILLYIPAFMLLAPFLAKLIYYAISRRREYLADACSALYTRYPEGLASALEKIAASTDQLLFASTATAPIFIVNPFRQRGMAASDITSTHPPISERIRILRAMAHASYAEYDRAYREVRGIDKGVIPAYAMASAGTTVIREAAPDELDHIQQARHTSNLLWNLNNYRTINCTCGIRMRLPPGFKMSEVKCPHCGTVIAV